MKSRRFSFFRFSLLLALVGIFLYSASVQEVHYLFINHAAERTEHCNNHLHTQTNHAECNLCKIELSSYVQSFQQFNSSAPVFSADLNPYQILDVKVNFKQSSDSPRGPPILA